MSMEIQTLLLTIYLFECLEDHVISCEDNNKPFLKKREGTPRVSFHVKTAMPVHDSRLINACMHANPSIAFLFQYPMVE